MAAISLLTAATATTAASAAGAGAAATGTVAGTAAAGGAAGAAAAGAAGGGAGIVGTIGAVGGLVGTGVQMYGQNEAAKASERAEKRRKEQLAVDSARARRKEIQKAIVSRAQVANAAAQTGTSVSSGAGGGYAQIASQAGSARQYIGQSEKVSEGLFSANAAIARGQSIASMGAGIASFSADIRQMYASDYFNYT